MTAGKLSNESVDRKEPDYIPVEQNDENYMTNQTFLILTMVRKQ